VRNDVKQMITNQRASLTLIRVALTVAHRVSFSESLDLAGPWGKVDNLTAAVCYSSVWEFKWHGRRTTSPR
jgi:hypothetical protein